MFAAVFCRGIRQDGNPAVGLERALHVQVDAPGRLIVETLARRGHTVFAGMRAVAGRNAPAADERLRWRYETASCCMSSTWTSVTMHQWIRRSSRSWE